MENGTSFKIFKKGEVVQGIVDSIKPSCVFVKLNDMQTGILYKEEVSKVRINNPADKLNVGDSIKATIKKYNNDTGKITLTLKSLNDADMANIKVDDVFSGVVRNKYKNSVFVEIKPNLVGLADYKSNVSYGDNVKVAVKKVSYETQKIKLEILD